MNNSKKKKIHISQLADLFLHTYFFLSLDQQKRKRIYIYIYIYMQLCTVAYGRFPSGISSCKGSD